MYDKNMRSETSKIIKIPKKVIDYTRAYGWRKKYIYYLIYININKDKLER